jgi:hypothetical protein
MALKKHFGITVFELLIIIIWTATALGVNIQMGGGKKLDMNQFQTVHQETFDAEQPPEKIFWGALDIDPHANNPWTGLLAKGVYTLSNTEQTGTVRYYFRQNLDPKSGKTLSEYPISVDVSGEMNAKVSAAGLLFAYNPQTKHYIAFVKGPGSTYTIYKHEEGGLRQITSGTSKAIHPNQSNQLAIIPNQSNLSFYINSTHITSIKDETATSGGAGLLAISSGRFQFDNFTIYNASKSDPVPLSQVDADHQIPTATHASAENRSQKTSTSQKSKLRSYEDVLFTGTSKQDVLQMFGPGWERGRHLFYDLGETDANMQDTTLIIQFDENDKLLSYKITQG